MKTTITVQSNTLEWLYSPDEEFVQTVSAQIPWSHNVVILDKIKTPEQREWYIRKMAGRTVF